MRVMSRVMTAADMGRKGGKSRSPKKVAAARKALARNRKLRWKKAA
mgnify:CR=1 FL=1